MSHQKKVLIAIVIAFSSIQTATATPSCTENIIDQSYYEFEEHNYVLNREEQIYLNNLISKLVGNWRGELKQIECRGGTEQLTKIVDSAPAKLKISSHSLNRVELNAQIDFRQQNKKTIYQRQVFEPRDINNFVTNGGNASILTEKNYRPLHFSLGTVLIETIYKIRLEQDRLHLDIITYSNGFFNMEERWILRRR